MITFIIFILVISVLVFVHELGHFLVAKRAGMKVEEFGLGFPPRAFGVRKGETLYSLNWIPFGGFVKIFGEDGGDRDQPQSFGSKTIGTRLKVVLAGVVMNFMFAALLLTVSNFVGLRVALDDSVDIAKAKNLMVQVTEVVADSPADKAGLKLLDTITGFRLSNGTLVATDSPKAIQEFIADRRGQTIIIVLDRTGETVEKEITLRANPPAGQGPIGISMALTGVITYPWYESLWRGVYNTVIMTMNTVYGYWFLFKTLFVQHQLIAQVSGPVGIASLTGQAARMGLAFLIQFVAMISVNLAVLNVVPFPALDGGRAFLLLVEKFRGRALNRKAEGLINAAGFAILITLMIVVTAKDVSRFF